MRIKLLVLFVIIISFSCKKADPNKPLVQVGAEEVIPVQPVVPTFTPFTTSTKTILASTSSTINDIITTDGKIYIIGDFSGIGTASSRCIVSFNGNSFFNVTNNLSTGSSIKTIEYFGGRLIFGGVFATSTSSNTRYFGYLSGSTVYTFSGISSSVNCFYNNASECYIGGYVTIVNSTSRNCAYYTGSSLNSYCSAMSSSVPVTYCMNWFGNRLYMGGSYSGSNEKNIVSNYNGNWQKADNGFNNYVYDLEVYNGKLYAGGSMTYDGNTSVPLNYVNSLASTTSSWQKTGTSNLPFACKSLETHNNLLLAACNNGSFGSLYCYNSSANAWVNCVSNFSVNRLDKIVSYNGKLYGIEKNTSTGTTYFVRFD